ncbi:diguanylate cyclase [Chloroflexota bacterium]
MKSNCINIYDPALSKKTSSLVSRIYLLEHQAKRHNTRLQISLIVIIALVAAVIDAAYHLGGALPNVPFWEYVLDWLLGAAIATAIILVVFRVVADRQAALFSSLKGFAEICEQPLDNMDWQNVIEKLSTSLRSRYIALYLQNPESSTLKKVSSTGTLPNITLPETLPANLWRSELGVLNCMQSSLCIVPCIGSTGEACGALIALPRRSSFKEWELAVLDTLASILAMASLKEQSVREWVNLANSDPLTGLKNRRSFNEILEREFRRSKRSGYPLSIIIIDVDGLKEINDNHGHLRGDMALRLVAKNLENNLRESDVAARLGGDEFGLVLTDTGEGDIKQIVGRLIQNGVITTLLGKAGEEVPVRASYGFATLSANDTLTENLISRADDRLYQFKKTRRLN